jgi:hypothetical protein
MRRNINERIKREGKGRKGGEWCGLGKGGEGRRGRGGRDWRERDEGGEEGKGKGMREMREM